MSNTSFFRPTREIRRADVQAACTVIGSTSSRDEFWVKFKRRNPDVPVIPTTMVTKGNVDVEDVHEWFEKPLMKELKERYQRGGSRE